MAKAQTEPGSLVGCPRGGAPRSALGRLALVLALAAVYVLAGRAGLMLGPVHVFASLVWAPTGISLAALLIFGTELWPGVALGALLVNVSTGAPLLAAAGIALGNTLEALAGAFALFRLGGFRRSLDGLKPVLVLIVAAGVLSTLIAATVGATSLLVGGRIAPGEFSETWRTWWLGDGAGDLIVAPLFLAFRGAHEPPRWTRRTLEAVGLCVAVVVASLLIFLSLPVSEAGRFVEASLLVPILMWGALRFGMMGATTTVFLASGIAVWGATLGRGPFVQATLSQSLLFLQSFMASTATAVLVVAGIIADRRRAYEAERASRLRAEAAEMEAKRLAGVQERLLAVVGHDLRNPLGAIVAGLSLFKKHRRDRFEKWEEALLERQSRSAARMEEIIKNVLYFAVARTSGTIPVKAEPINMGEVCRQVIGEFEQVEPGRKVSLRVEGDDSGEWDASRMAQVLSNLVGNALEHSPKDTPVDVRICGSAQNLVVQVHNAGPAIPSEALAEIFEPFKQGLDGAPGAKANVGLGLYIVKEIVEAHAGKVDVCSREGQGTSFVVKLPRASPTSGPGRGPQPGPSLFAPSGPEALAARGPDATGDSRGP